MSYDLIVIGAGLSGLFAGCLAARRGKKTLMLARGVGGTHIGTGKIDVAKDPALISKPPEEHPYALIGRKTLKAALEEFQRICEEGGYPMRGEFGKNVSLPTAVGGTRQSCLIPETMGAGDLAHNEPTGLANLPNFRDFNAALAVSNLQSSNSQFTIRNYQLPLPHAPTHRDAYATDLARLFDLAGYRDEVIAAWKPVLTEAVEGGLKRLGLPAILGLDKPLEAKAQLETGLGLELFEIPILPPSVPGMRLYNLLLNDFQSHGGRFIMGPVIKGKVEKGSASITADMNGRVQEYKTANMILATGGFLNGGLVAEFEGAIRETTFNLPVSAPSQRSAWTSEHFLGPQPYARFGLRVNKNMQPLDAAGKPIAGNLRAIGGILGGADRLSEGSREGIALASAWRAVETLG